MDVADVPHRVRKGERIRRRAVDHGGLFVEKEGRISMTEIPLDLAEPLQRRCQIPGLPRLPEERDRLGEMAAGIVQPILASRPVRLLDEFARKLRFAQLRRPLSAYRPRRSY